MKPVSTASGERRTQRVAAVMVLVAATLAVASAVHLFGHVHGRNSMFQSDDAGIAEAIISAVLLVGAFAMWRSPARARTIGLAATGFAIAGFLLGLTITLQGGHLPDIVYHLTVLPVLVGCEIVLSRIPSGPTPSSGPGGPTDLAVDAGGDVAPAARGVR